MKINNIIYPSFNSTNGISVDIFVAGCSRKPHCKNCHNPTLWDFNNGVLVDKNYTETLLTWLNQNTNLFDNIAIMGGEPLDQNLNDLLYFVCMLYIHTNKNIWLYTSYELEEIPFEIKQYCHYIKTGRYIPELSTDNNIQHGIKLATSNQQIHKLG